MKTPLILLAILAFLFSPATTSAEIDGHVGVTYASDTGPNDYPAGYVHLSDIGFSIHPVIRLDSQKWDLVMELELAESRMHNGNWIQELSIGYKVNEEWSIRLGRLSTAGIILTPPPWLLQTARYPRVPVGIYGWGGQMQYNRDRWTATLDVTGNTGTSFQSKNAFDRIETGLRLEYKATEELSVAANAAYDFRDRELFGAVDVNFKKERFDAHLVGYATNNDVLGGFLYAGYQVTDHLELHGMVDMQRNERTSTTAGIRYSWGSNDVTADWSHSEDEDVFMLRYRYLLGKK